jgi:short subunit dehydrogenase-like uncharacterized protein
VSSRRIVVFGATGYTGRLTAEALVRRGYSPVLAGRDNSRLAGLASELGGLDVDLADTSKPQTVRDLVEPGAVLVTTVGPFLRLGSAAVTAAIDGGAIYLDSGGEPPFIRRVFEEFGPAATRAGIPLLSSFAFNCVAGNLAAAMALREGGAARRVDIGYFMPGHRRGSESGGARASFLGAAPEPSFAWRGRIRTERGAARVRSFEVAGARQSAVSVGTSDHFTLPRLHPELREVNTYLGFLSGPPRLMQGLSLVGAGITRAPWMRRLVRAASQRIGAGSTGGPAPDVRAKTATEVIAIAYDQEGRELSGVRYVGNNSYEFSASILAWGASHAADDGVTGTGALGPVEAFGLDVLEAACKSAGMHRAA